jgi:hypothetical protein
MRALLVGMALAAFAAGGGPPMASRHKIAWGWGCGGNCAVNFSGESETLLDSGPRGVRLEDRGTLTRRQSDPGGLTTSTTRWRYAFHGTGTAGVERREYTLHTDVSECTRTDETAAQGKAATTRTARCAEPPKRWKLVCAYRQMQVKGQARPAWVCSPAPPMDAFGTDFPWVFGIDAPITTVVSGEPHPHSSYE